jgi:hypothetical protein
MGTKGWLAFVWKGKYYCIPNSHDSYESGMGVQLLEQIFELLKKFHGDVRSACNHWGNLLENISYENYGNIDYNDAHPLNRVAYEDLEKGLSDTSKKVGLVLPFGSTEIDWEFYASDLFFCSFIWRINLDLAEFGMGPSGEAHDLFIETPFKLIYKLLLNPLTREVNRQMWLDDAESFEYDFKEDFVSYKRRFFVCARVMILQANTRRFLTQRRMLEPGVGKLYFEAKKRFDGAATANM